MYCVKCGVKLADTETRCPLCQTRVFHPDLSRESTEPLYPKGKYPSNKPNSYFIQVFFSAVFLLPILIVLLCDMQFGGGVTWAGYVIGAILLGYVTFILPAWFKRPNPVIFVSCDFAAVGVYLLYINLVTGGDWFLSFAFPVVGGVGTIMITVVTLLRYLKKGRLFIIGGASIALGAFMLLMEFLMCITFDALRFIGWSLYPLTTLVLLGGVLIFLGISRTAREMMERKLFI